MADSITKIEEIPPATLKQQFEELLLLTLKEFRNTILNHDDRIQELEAKVKALEQGGK